MYALYKIFIFYYYAYFETSYYPVNAKTNSILGYTFNLWLNHSSTGPGKAGLN